MTARERPDQQLQHDHRAVAALVAIVLLVGCAVLLARSFASTASADAGSRPGAAASATSPAPIGVPSAAAAGATGAPTRPAGGPRPAPADVPVRSNPEADAGAASPGSTAITGLDPELRRRFGAAAKAAGAVGVRLTITSGWRSAAAQQRIIAADIATYGSATEAHRWVLPPDKSAHVQGEAIDVGPAAGAAWLGAHGAAFGLCRTYANESWHFEPVIAPGGTCPAPHPDSSWGW